MKLGCAVLAGLLAAGVTLAESWKPQPWLEDLDQIRQALDTKYANRDWLIRDREIDLSAMLDRTATRLREAGSDAEARAILDRLIQHLGDGHVVLQWPRPSLAPPPSPPTDVCAQMGFDARQSSPGVARGFSGFVRVGNDDDIFPAGIVDAAGTRVGVLRISVFHPSGTPQLCRSALKQLNLRADQACDERCKDAVLTRSYDLLTTSLEAQIRALQAEGAQQLLVDITGNGGGSEWVEAAARIISPKPLQSGQRGFVRGEHWAKQWRELSNQLRGAAKTATPADRAQLLAWAAEADSARQEAEKPCTGQRDCEWLGRAGFSTGLVGQAAAGTFDGKPWGVHVFSPAQYPYYDGVWRGPVVVLVDQHTGSAAEEFAAILQDNGAAIVMGARTGGGGCGYTNGGTPTTLKNSRAILRVPDCARLRPNGSNEVNGVIPNVLVGMHARDTAKFKARLVQGKLPEAVQFAASALSWPEPAQENLLSMRLQESAHRTDLHLHFSGYHDARCPADVRCAMAGEARAFFWIQGTNIKPQLMSLPWRAGIPGWKGAVAIGKYEFALRSLEPRPLSSRIVPPADYRAVVEFRLRQPAAQP